MPRFFVKTKLANSKRVDFSDEQTLQMQKVLRMKVGDKVEVFDNTYNIAIVELEKLSKEATYGKIIEDDFRIEESKVVIFQAFPKNPKSELIVQKCTELGVDAIAFFESDHSILKTEEIGDKKMQRLVKISVEAAEQSGRVTVPNIFHEVAIFSEFIEVILGKKELKYLNQEFENFFYLDPEGDWLDKVEFKNPKGLSAVFIGPEGGFSPKEKEIFDKNGFKKIKIANNILRCETAGITFMSQYNLVNSSR